MHFEYDYHKNYKLVNSKSFYKSKGITGLLNLGNKCFFNSIIQCLSNTLKLTDYLLSINPVSIPFNSDLSFSKTFIHLLQHIWESNQLLRPTAIVKSFSLKKDSFSSEQQDSHEFLLFFLDFLHTSLTYDIDISIVGIPTSSSDKLMLTFIDSWKHFFKNNYSFIIECFYGMTYNLINCSNCTFSDIVFEPFNTLSINIPQSDSTLSLCLDSFLTTSHIPSWNCEKCSKSGCDSSLSLWSLPNHLIIHLKRFTNESDKIYSKISFPIDDLNLTKYISSHKQDPNNYIYSLYAVNYHSGSTESGHYWSACKNLDNNWYSFDDGNTCLLNSNNIVTENAYILFYYRKFIS